MLKVIHNLIKINNHRRVAVTVVFLAVLMSASAAAPAEEEGVIHVAGLATVRDTVAKLQRVLAVKKMTVFLQLDHAEAARQSGYELRDMQLLLFGNPTVGSALIKCAPTVGIDLPLKVLVWEDLQGNVWVSYNDMNYLADRHDMSVCKPVVEKVAAAMANIAVEISAP
jgi:uncharacterized protein (DUF302 family)